MVADDDDSGPKGTVATDIDLRWREPYAARNLQILGVPDHTTCLVHIFGSGMVDHTGMVLSCTEIIQVSSSESPWDYDFWIFETEMLIDLKGQMDSCGSCSADLFWSLTGTEHP